MSRSRIRRKHAADAIQLTEYRIRRHTLAKRGPHVRENGASTQDAPEDKDKDQRIYHPAEDLRSAKARIDVGKGEIRFRVEKEDMFFRFKKKEEQCFMIQQNSEGQALWGEPEPQPEHRPSTPKRKKKAKKVSQKVESSASSSSPGRADQW